MTRFDKIWQDSCKMLGIGQMLSWKLTTSNDIPKELTVSLETSLASTELLHGGFLKQGNPQIIHFSGILHYKPSSYGGTPISGLPTMFLDDDIPFAESPTHGWREPSRWTELTRRHHRLAGRGKICNPYSSYTVAARHGSCSAEDVHFIVGIEQPWGTSESSSWESHGNRTLQDAKTFSDLEGSGLGVVNQNPICWTVYEYIRSNSKHWYGSLLVSAHSRWRLPLSCSTSLFLGKSLTTFLVRDWYLCTYTYINIRNIINKHA